MPSLGSKLKLVDLALDLFYPCGFMLDLMGVVALRKSSRTSMKRRVRWEEKCPELDDYDAPDQVSGPPCNESLVASACKVKDVDQPGPPLKRVKQPLDHAGEG